MESQIIELLKKYKGKCLDIKLANEALDKLDIPPDMVAVTGDNSIQFVYWRDKKNFELEFFEDGSITFSEEDDIMDISYEQLDEKISLINKWLKEEYSENHSVVKRL